jgi:hypothetical protein
MSSEAELEIQRRLATEFADQDWGYDLRSGRQIARAVVAAGAVDPGQLARLVSLASLTRERPTRSAVASAIARALNGLDLQSAEQRSVMRILFVSAGPANHQGLRLDAEHRDVQGRIQASTFRDRVDVHTALAARPTDLIDALNRLKPTVLHIAGHGSSETGIELENEVGLAVDVSGDQLRRLVELADSTLRLVVLNSCQSSIHAQPLVKHVDAAIGMARSIGDPAARTFAAQLYASLAEGVPVPRAMSQACLQISLAGINEDQTPKLFTAAGVSAGRLTLT